MDKKIENLIQAFYYESDYLIDKALKENVGISYQEAMDIYNNGYDDNFVQYHKVTPEIQVLSDRLYNFIFDMQYTKALDGQEIANDMFRFIFFCVTGIISKTAHYKSIDNGELVGCKKITSIL